MKQVDKGFVFFYWNLSNRRKFIRSIWATAVGLLISAYALVTVKDKAALLALVAAFVVLAVVQLVETYRKYKGEQKART